MKRTLFTFTAVLLGPLAALHAADTSQTASQPNVLVILADDK